MSGEAVERAGLGPNSYGRMRREARQRKAVVTAVVAVLLAATFVLVTGQTGFPGPGPMRRYRTAELQALADQLNLLVCPADDPVPPPGASVDGIRSRVHLEHPGSVIVSPGDRPTIENPGSLTTGLLPTRWEGWSRPACTDHGALG
jgi:hypothetical protein